MSIKNVKILRMFLLFKRHMILIQIDDILDMKNDHDE